MCIEVFKVFKPFTDAKFDNGKVQIVRNGDGNATLGCSIELCDDDAVEV